MKDRSDMKYWPLLVCLILLGCAQKKYFYIHMQTKSFIEYKTSAYNPDLQNIHLHADQYCKSSNKLPVFEHQYLIAGQNQIAFRCVQPEGGYKFFNDPIQIKPGRVL
tara:strand:- start:3356 stop:3676 length:321 start_codon:yes stop_codon:yes gene_type:complete